VAVAAAAASLVLPAGAVAADEPAAVTVVEDAALERSTSEFLGLINSLRSSRGLPALQIHAELTASAQAWAGSMASSGVLAHDPNLGSAASGWTSIGENVGMGPSVNSIWSAFLASPQHFANLTSTSWTHIGVGFVRSGQAMWTTHRFMTMGATPPPPPPPTAPPATAPPATAPVTAPPAPVVTAPPAPVAPQAPATVPVPPVTTAPPATVPASGGAGDADASIAGDPSAEADRVAEVINALQALPG
jgi:uncharacterized protein YkwD